MGPLASLEPSNVTSDTGKRVLARSPPRPAGPLIHVFAKNVSVALVSQAAGNRSVLAMAVKGKSVEGVRVLQEVIQTCQVG
ncbi:proteasome assembly chaperone 3 [Camelus ferus]|nr:proteasome assembly chaperone 3 [Camelus ferus]